MTAGTKTGRIRTDSPNYELRDKHDKVRGYDPVAQSKPRAGAVTASDNSNIRANCGCGWFRQTTDPDSIYSVFEAAVNHRAETNHRVDILGILR